MKQLNVGWFTFTCCEDSTVVFTEVLNDHWKEWKKLINFKHARVLQRNNILEDIDVAFVEGAVSSEEQKQRVEEIRAHSKMVVAVGACAVTGMPAGQRNTFDEKTKEEIGFIVERFHHLDRVQSIKEVIQVDAELPGCPMNADQFVKLVQQALIQFGIVQSDA